MAFSISSGKSLHNRISVRRRKMASTWKDTVIGEAIIKHEYYEDHEFSQLSPMAKAGVKDMFYDHALFFNWIARTQAEKAWHARDKEEITFLDEILHLPFFEFCLRVKERKQMLIKDLASPAKRMGN